MRKFSAFVDKNRKVICFWDDKAECPAQISFDGTHARIGRGEAEGLFVLDALKKAFQADVDNHPEWFEFEFNYS